MLMSTYKRNGKAGKAKSSTHTGSTQEECEKERERDGERAHCAFRAYLENVCWQIEKRVLCGASALLVRLINNLNLNLINNLVSSRTRTLSCRGGEQQRRNRGREEELPAWLSLQGKQVMKSNGVKSSSVSAPSHAAFQQEYPLGSMPYRNVSYRSALSALSALPALSVLPVAAVACLSFFIPSHLLATLSREGGHI